MVPPHASAVAAVGPSLQIILSESGRVRGQGAAGNRNPERLGIRLYTAAVVTTLNVEPGRLVRCVASATAGEKPSGSTCLSATAAACSVAMLADASGLGS